MGLQVAILGLDGRGERPSFVLWYDTQQPECTLPFFCPHCSFLPMFGVQHTMQHPLTHHNHSAGRPMEGAVCCRVGM